MKEKEKGGNIGAGRLVLGAGEPSGAGEDRHALPAGAGALDSHTGGARIWSIALRSGFLLPAPSERGDFLIPSPRRADRHGGACRCSLPSPSEDERRESPSRRLAGCTGCARGLPSFAFRRELGVSFCESSHQRAETSVRRVRGFVWQRGARCKSPATSVAALESRPVRSAAKVSRARSPGLLPGRTEKEGFPPLRRAEG